LLTIVHVNLLHRYKFHCWKNT